MQMTIWPLLHKHKVTAAFSEGLGGSGEYGHLAEHAYTNMVTWPNRLTPIWAPCQTGLH